MANCEKCGLIKLEDARCGHCGGSLIKNGSHAWCGSCNKDSSGVCVGHGGWVKNILIFGGIIIGIIIFFQVCVGL